MSKSILRLNRRRLSARTNPQFTMSNAPRSRAAKPETATQKRERFWTASDKRSFSKRATENAETSSNFPASEFCFLIVAARQWWSRTGSNRRPEACKATALPAELWPLVRGLPRNGVTPWILLRPPEMVGLGRFELPTSRLSSARSNQLSYRPESRVIREKKEKRRRRCPAFDHSHRPDSLAGTVIQREPIRQRDAET